MLQGASINTIFNSICINYLKEKNMLRTQKRMKANSMTFKVCSWVRFENKYRTLIEREKWSENFKQSKLLELGLKCRMPTCPERAVRTVVINETKCLGLSKMVIKVKPNSVFNNVETLYNHGYPPFL